MKTGRDMGNLDGVSLQFHFSHSTSQPGLTKSTSILLPVFLGVLPQIYICILKILPVTRSLHPSLRVWSMDTAGRSREENPAFETKCLRRLLGISYLDHKTNEYVRDKIKDLVGPQEPLLATVKRRKLGWFSQITRHDSLPKTILQGTLEGGGRRGRQKKELGG